jgi:hypothetical protein
MADNRQIKDGLGNLFTVRMRDFSTAQDGTVQRSMILATPYPIDYGLGGIYLHRARTTVDLPAGLAAAAPIYSFMWISSTLTALISRISISAWTTGTGFAPGLARFNMYAARPFTAQDGNGTMVNFAASNAKLASNMASSIANIIYANNGAALTPGTRTLDADGLEAVMTAAPTTANTPFSYPALSLFDRRPGEQPLLLALNEGFVIQATVPATGTWQFALTLDWAEVQKF